MTKAKTGFSLLALAAGLLLAGCSNWPDSLNPGSWFESPDPNANVPGPQKTYPKLSSVPEKPAPRDEAAEKKAEDELKADRDAARAVAPPKLGGGLVADRDSARYTDDNLRREDTRTAVPPPPAPPPTPAATARNATPTAPPPPPDAAPRAAPPVQSAKAEPIAPPPPPVPQPQQQVAAAPIPALPPTRAVAPAPPAPMQQAALPPAAPPPAPDIIAMAPVRSPGDPRPAASAPPQPSHGNLVWGAPPSDIDLVRSGARGRETSVSTLRRGAVGAAMSGGPAATVMFASGSARLAPTDEALLRQVAEAYRRAGGTVSVIGHASATAADRANVRRQIANFSVSMDRANAVAQALQRYGVPGNAIAISAQTDAVVLNDADGRRADVYLR